MENNRTSSVLVIWIVVFILLLLFAFAYGVAAAEPTMAFNNDFTVLAPEGTEDILKAATQYKKEIANEWGVAPGNGPTTISYSPSASDTAFTWARSGKRKYHTVYLQTNLHRAKGSTLKHEIAHVVLAWRVPIWINEGIACSYDDKERKDIRSRIANESPMRVWEIFKLDEVKSGVEYANSESLSNYLISLGGKKRLASFGVEAKEMGHTAALASWYGVTAKELEERWRLWQKH